MQNYCLFIEKWKNNRSGFFRDVCFARTDFRKLKELVYFPKLEAGLTKEHAQFWIGFVKALFPNDLPFEYEIVDKSLDGGRLATYIQWTMKVFSPIRHHNLLYTTAFRYPDEFPYIVRLMFASNLKKEGGEWDYEALFTMFYHMHIGMAAGKGEYDWMAYIRPKPIMNHALIDPTAGTSSWNPITLARFHENLRRPIHGVQLHFA